jgi:hypothetical protein
MVAPKITITFASNKQALLSCHAMSSHENSLAYASDRMAGNRTKLTIQSLKWVNQVATHTTNYATLLVQMDQ